MQKLSIHIGINQYDRSVYGDADLAQCVRDAKSMYDLAENIGFSPILLTDFNATWNSYFDLMRECADKLKAGDVLLITQSSHGTYWDTNKRRSTGLCMFDQVLWDFEQIQIWKWFAPGVRILRVVDCCFAESNFRKTGLLGRARTTTLKESPNIKPTAGSLRSAKATIISLASSSVKEVSWENEGGGVFTQVFEQAFQATAVPSYKYVLQACRNLLDAWGYPQTPKLETSKAGKYKNVPFGT
jgi:hypothetical protein